MSLIKSYHSDNYYYKSYPISYICNYFLLFNYYNKIIVNCLKSPLANFFKNCRWKHFGQYWPAQLSYRVTGFVQFLFFNSVSVEKCLKQHRQAPTHTQR